MGKGIWLILFLLSLLMGYWAYKTLEKGASPSKSGSKIEESQPEEEFRSIPPAPQEQPTLPGPQRFEKRDETPPPMNESPPQVGSPPPSPEVPDEPPPPPPAQSWPESDPYGTNPPAWEPPPPPNEDMESLPPPPSEFEEAP